MREIAVDGTVRRVDVGTYQDKNGKTVARGTVVLNGSHDKLEIGLPWPDPSPRAVEKMRGLGEGQVVRLLVGVESGDNRRAEPQFVFLDDLTPPAKS